MILNLINRGFSLLENNFGLICFNIKKFDLTFRIANKNFPILKTKLDLSCRVLYCLKIRNIFGLLFESPKRNITFLIAASNQTFLVVKSYIENSRLMNFHFEAFKLGLGFDHHFHNKTRIKFIMNFEN